MCNTTYYWPTFLAFNYSVDCFFFLFLFSFFLFLFRIFSFLHPLCKNCYIALPQIVVVVIFFSFVFNSFSFIMWYKSISLMQCDFHEFTILCWFGCLHYLLTNVETKSFKTVYVCMCVSVSVYIFVILFRIWFSCIIFFSIQLLPSIIIDAINEYTEEVKKKNCKQFTRKTASAFSLSCAIYLIQQKVTRRMRLKFVMTPSTLFVISILCIFIIAIAFSFYCNFIFVCCWSGT